MIARPLRTQFLPTKRLMIVMEAKIILTAATRVCRRLGSRQWQVQHLRTQLPRIRHQPMKMRTLVKQASLQVVQVQLL